MPMPQPKSGESESNYVNRCMVDNSMKEYEQDQRAAICYSTFRDTNKECPKDAVVEKVRKIRNVVGDHLAKIEKEEVRKMYSPDINDLNFYIRKDIQDITNEGMGLVENIFLRCRKDGMDFNKSYEVSKSFYNKEYDKLNRSEVLTSIYEVVKSVHDRILKAKKVEVGQTRKRKDGTYKKVGEGKWEKLETEKFELL